MFRLMIIPWLGYDCTLSCDDIKRRDIIVISVYCEKMSQSGLSASVTGLIGIGIGAFIGLCTAYLTQRWQHKNSLSLEQSRNRIKLFTDFALADILKFLDKEIDYIQLLYTRMLGNERVNADYEGNHRYELAKHKAALEMFKDQELMKKFEELLKFRDEFSLPQGKVVMNMFDYDPTESLEKAAKLAGEIKISLFDHCSIK